MQSASHRLRTFEDADSKEQKSEESKDSEKQQITLADAVPSTPPQISFDYHFLLIEPSREDSEEKQSNSFDVDIPLEKALKILFRQIISPNAP